MSGTTLVDVHPADPRPSAAPSASTTSGKLVVDFGTASAPRALVELLRGHRDELLRIYGSATPAATVDNSKPATGIPYRWWKPGDRLAATTLGFDTETEAVGDINDPGSKPPRLVVATATDGVAGFYIAPDDLAAFLEAHTTPRSWSTTCSLTRGCASGPWLTARRDHSGR